MKYLLAIALTLCGAAPFALSSTGRPATAATCDGHTCETSEKVCVACLEEQYEAELEAIEASREEQRDRTEDELAAFREQREDALEMTREQLEMELEARSEELERVCEELERRYEEQCEALEAECEAYEESLEARAEALEERIEDGDCQAKAELASLEQELERMQAQFDRRQHQVERTHARELAELENQLAVQERELARASEREMAQYERDLARWERDLAKNMEAAERDAERQRASLERHFAREAERARRAERPERPERAERAERAAREAREAAERLARVEWAGARGVTADGGGCCQEKSSCETPGKSVGVARVQSPRTVVRVAPEAAPGHTVRTYRVNGATVPGATSESCGSASSCDGEKGARTMAWGVGSGDGHGYSFRINTDGKDVQVIGPDGARGEISYAELGDLGSGTYAVRSDGGVVQLKSLGKGAWTVQSEGSCGTSKDEAKSKSKTKVQTRSGHGLGDIGLGDLHIEGDFAIRIGGAAKGDIQIIAPDGITGEIDIDDLSGFEPGVYFLDTESGEAELVPAGEADDVEWFEVEDGDVAFLSSDDMDFDVAFFEDLAVEMEEAFEDFEFDFEELEDLAELEDVRIEVPELHGMAPAHAAAGELQVELGELSELLREMRAEMRELREAVRTLRGEVRSLETIR